MRFQSVLITLAGLALSVVASPGFAQSFRVQCPTSTVTHPITTTNDNNHEPAYQGPTTFVSSVASDPAAAASPYQKQVAVKGHLVPSANINGAIKCQQISGGDGYSTMADGTQTYMFSFGPLSGIAKIAAGQPATDFPDEFNLVYSGASPLRPGDPATTDLGPDYVPSQSTPPQPLTSPPFTYNGAVGLEPDADCLAANPGSPSACGNAAGIDGHVDPRQIEDIGVMNGNIPAPLMAVDEDDEFFLTLTNVGMIMRPDLFEQHTVHWHGYPNASAYYDGVPEPSVAINIGGSFTYYYLAPDAGTYFWHCHITPPEHLQMGMVGQIYVRPRQDREPIGMDLYAGLQLQQLDPRTACNSATDILCSNPLPASGDDGVKQANDPDTATAADSTGRPYHYAYNDGDGSTAYDVSYPLQIHGFDPNFHFIGMTFNAEPFVNMKDKYFLLNGRSYPDTVTPGPMQTESSDGAHHFSQPLSAIVNVPVGGRVLLRISDLDVTEYQTLASLGIRMTVIALNAKLLRDQAGHNLYYKTNSITLGGGESLDVILDASGRDASGHLLYPAGSTYYLYTPNLDHLSNDAENFGGLMTEVRICPASTPNVDPNTRQCVADPNGRATT